MTKAELCQSVREKSGLTLEKSTAAVNAVLESMTEAFVKGDSVTFTGFGTFTVKAVPEHIGRNPRTGEEIALPASRRVVFKPGKALKNAVN